MKKYYNLWQKGKEVNITIYGDITSWEWDESDVSSYTLAKELEGIEADTINVYINSYGGEVGEGLAIYNLLKRQSAKVKTYCDGFAASIASVIFMAGDERIVSNASLLFIHNAWTIAGGNAEEFRKVADDLDIISQPAINVYRDAVNIDEKKLAEMLAAETWILPEDAVKMGFATEIYEQPAKAANQSAQKIIFEMVKAAMKKEPLQSQLDELKNAILQLQEKPKEPEKPEPPKENKPLKMMAALFRKQGGKIID